VSCCSLLGGHLILTLVDLAEKHNSGEAAVGMS
jgi:hypothetical protein